MDFSVLILATGSWPITGSSVGFSLPVELQISHQHFEKFYTTNHNGRKITWLHQLAKGEVKINYTTTNKTGYFLSGTGYQLGILLQFSQSEALTLKEFQIATQLNENALLPILRPLLKFKILNCNPPVADAEKSPIEPNSSFTLNKQFKSTKVKVSLLNLNIAPARAEGGKAEAATDETMANVMDERKLLIQAAIVRIMKARKTMKHVNLVSEVVEQLNSRFKPQVPQIKKCIDILIEKEYLERVKTEKDSYSYVA